MRLACQESGQPVPQTRAQTVRVVLDSLARKVAAVLDILEEVSGQPIQTVHVVGGGSRIDLLNTLIAEASGRVVVAGPVEATLEGNLLVQSAILGLLGASQIRDVVRASASLRMFHPRSQDPQL